MVQKFGSELSTQVREQVHIVFDRDCEATSNIHISCRTIPNLSVGTVCVLNLFFPAHLPEFHQVSLLETD